MKKFEIPEIEIEELAIADVITSSPCISECTSDSCSNKLPDF